MEFSSPLWFVPSRVQRRIQLKSYQRSPAFQSSCRGEVLRAAAALARAPWATWSAPSSLTHSRLSPVIFTCAFRKLSSAVEPAGEQGPRERPNAYHGSQRGNGRADGNERGFDWQADRQASRGRPAFSRGQEAQALANAGCVPTRRARHASVESSAIPLRAPVLTELSACRAWLALVTCEHVCSDAHGVADRRRWKKCWT